MTRLRYILLLVLLLPFSLLAQTGSLTGVALDSVGNTVAGATITVCVQGSPGIPCAPVTASTTSNGQGAFSVTVPVGTYTVTVFRLGVVATSSTVVVAPSNITVANNVIYTGSVTFSGTLNAIPIVSASNFTSVQAALNSLSGAAGIVFVPPGTWAPAAANTPLTITNSFQRVMCAGMDSTVISYTGTTNITAVVDVGQADNGTLQQVNNAVTNCTISGNSHTTYALRVRGTHRSDFSHNKLINAVTAGLFSDFAVADTWDDLHTSSQEQAFTTVPASCFIFDGPDTSHRTTASLVKNPICEGVSGTGIVINNASSITIKGGTSEQNGKGITLGAGSLSNIIDGVDTEANTTSNVEDGGQQNAFRNLIGNGTYKVVAGANSSYWLGLVYDTFSNAGNFTYLDYFAFNNSGTGTFTDTGTNSVRHWVQKLSVGQQFGDEYGTCVFAASTTCAVTFSPTWINAPLVFIQPINAGAVTFTITAGPSTTGFTITASASNSLTVDWSASLH